MTAARWCIAIVAGLAACEGGELPEARLGTPAPMRASGSPVPVVASCVEATKVTVSGRANIFGAGIDELPAPGGGGGGAPPACVVIPAGVSRVELPHVEGTISFTPLRAPDTHLHKCPGGLEVVLSHGPDGNAGGCPGEPPGHRWAKGMIDGAGIVSGIASGDRGGYLIGVYLPTDPGDASPPPAIHFGGNYDFTRLAPALGQLFSVGDGRTQTGHLQRFEIPRGATRLYLGIADAWGFRGPPGFFDDNDGAFRVRVRFR